MTRALVTGGTGFAGRYLVAHLAGQGVEVHATSHWRDVESPSATAIHAVDVSNLHDLHKLVRKLKPDEIYHLAGVTQPSSGNVSGFYDVNLGGARNILDAASTADTPPAVLIVGSAYAYAPSDGPISEDWPLAPRNHYGASKAAAEMLGRAYAADGLHVVMARPFNHSGPGQNPVFVLPSIVAQVVQQRQAGGRAIELELGNLESVRDVSDVRDIVRGYVDLLRRGLPGAAYNFGSGHGETIRGLVDLVSETADVAITITQTPGRMRADDIPKLVADISAARAMGWSPAIPLHETVADMLKSGLVLS
jgi:GDP-4-dehydro-6-deoxy-D-mannose reductase